MELDQKSLETLKKVNKNINRELMGYCRKDICVVDERDNTHRYYYEPKLWKGIDYKLKIIFNQSKERKERNKQQLLSIFDKMAAKNFEKTL